MNRGLDRDGYRVRGDVHQSYMFEKGLCIGDNRRWEVHRWPRSIRTKTFVVGSCHAPWSPFFTSVHVPFDGKYVSEEFRPELQAGGGEA